MLARYVRDSFLAVPAVAWFAHLLLAALRAQGFLAVAVECVLIALESFALCSDIERCLLHVGEGFDTLNLHHNLHRMEIRIVVVVQLACLMVDLRVDLKLAGNRE